MMLLRLCNTTSHPINVKASQKLPEKGFLLPEKPVCWTTKISREFVLILQANFRFFPEATASFKIPL